MAATKKTKKAAKKRIPGKGPHPLYGMPIDKAIASGDVATMRRVATRARSYLKELQTAMKALDRRIGKAG